MDIKNAFKAAVGNIAQFGDTDVFPTPFERHIFHDTPAPIIALLEQIHANLDTALAQYPPQNIDTLAPVGYTGFRWATEIDPVWNAYFLGLAIFVAHHFEPVRLPEAEGAVFSYRFAYDSSEHKLFKDSAWRNYKKKALDISRK